MKNCQICSREVKISIGDEHLRTRIPGKEVIVVKGVHYYQCTVCDYKVLTESSEETVKTIRKHYTDKYFNKQSEQNSEALIPNQFKGILKRFRAFN